MNIQTPDIKGAIQNSGKVLMKAFCHVAGVLAVASVLTSSVQPILTVPAQGETPITEELKGNLEVKRLVYEAFQKNVSPIIASALVDDATYYLAEPANAMLREPKVGVNELDGGTEGYVSADVYIFDEALNGTALEPYASKITYTKGLRDGYELVWQESGSYDFSLSFEIVRIDETRWGVRIWHYGSESTKQIANSIADGFNQEAYDDSGFQLILNTPEGINASDTFPVIDRGVSPMSRDYEGFGDVYWLGSDGEGNPKMVRAED